MDEPGAEPPAPPAPPTASPTPPELPASGPWLDGDLVPMRSEREAGILKLLSEAGVKAPRLPPSRRTSRMAIIGNDIKEFLEQTPEENGRAFIRRIVESVQSESYLRLTTDEERALAEEASRDEWDRQSAKKKRRSWRRGQ